MRPMIAELARMMCIYVHYVCHAYAHNRGSRSMIPDKSLDFIRNVLFSH